MTLVLSEDDVRLVLDMPTAIEAVEESLRRQAAGDARPHPRREIRAARARVHELYGGG